VRYVATKKLLPSKKPKIFYGYVIVAAGFFIMLIVHGVINTFGVFFNPLLAQFDTSRAALSTAYSCSFFTMGFSVIIVGILADRFGPRVILTICAIFYGVGHLLMSQANALWQLYLCFIVIGIGFSPADVVPLSIIVRWFVRRRGVMSGVMKVGTGLGIMAVPLLASVLIDNFEWRTSYIILGTLVLVAVVPLAQFLRKSPRDMDVYPDGDKRLNVNSPVFIEEGLSLRQAVRTPQLWMVCGFYISIMFCAQSILTHIVPHAMDLGIAPTVAAGIVSTIGGMSMFGRLAMGFTGDKIGHKRAMIICFTFLVIAICLLLVTRELWMFYLFAAVYGFNHGGFFALISPMVAGLFGTRSQGTMLGIIICSGTLVGSISPILTGMIFDVKGSYQLAFLIILIIAVAGLILTTLIKPIAKGGTDESRRSA